MHKTTLGARMEPVNITDIERMAREAGYEVDESAIRSPGYTSPDDRERLTKLVALVAEDLAQIADTAANQCTANATHAAMSHPCSLAEQCVLTGAARQAQKLADAIRAKYPMPKEPG